MTLDLVEYAQSLVRAMWSLEQQAKGTLQLSSTDTLDAQWLRACEIADGIDTSEFAMQVIAEAAALRLEGG